MQRRMANAKTDKGTVIVDFKGNESMKYKATGRKELQQFPLFSYRVSFG